MYRGGEQGVGADINRDTGGGGPGPQLRSLASHTDAKQDNLVCL